MTKNGNDNRTMIERVAEAIWMANRPPGAPRYEDLTFNEQDTVEIIAAACFKAMRRPTISMMVAAEQAVPELSCFDEEENSPSFKAWQAMIDAALEEE